MAFGRLMGWALLGMALLLASGDAVMALEPGDHLRFVTGDMWALVAGRAPHPGVLPAFVAMLLTLPAWTLLGPAGIGLILAFRQRRRYIFRH